MSSGLFRRSGTSIEARWVLIFMILTTLVALCFGRFDNYATPPLLSAMRYPAAEIVVGQSVVLRYE